jgi:hypothetical protein
MRMLPRTQQFATENNRPDPLASLLQVSLIGTIKFDFSQGRAQDLIEFHWPFASWGLWHSAKRSHGHVAGKSFACRKPFFVPAAYKVTTSRYWEKLALISDIPKNVLWFLRRKERRADVYDHKNSRFVGRFFYQVFWASPAKTNRWKLVFGKDETQQWFRINMSKKNAIKQS